MAEACLAYQNHQGANVNLLLFCCWLGSLGREIGQTELAQASAKIEIWDARVVQPLRSVRQFVSGSSLSADTLLNDLKQVELKAEQVVQNCLYDWWFQQQESVETAVTTEPAVALLTQENLNRYLLLLGIDEPIEAGSALLWPVSQ